MTRVKWMRLIVRDAGDVLRWAGDQRARHLCEFRHRVIHGHEVVSFRMLPHYAIQIGAREIVVVCHVRGGPGRAISRIARALRRRVVARLDAVIAQAAPASVSVPPAAPTRPDAPIPLPVRRPV